MDKLRQTTHRIGILSQANHLPPRRSRSGVDFRSVSRSIKCQRQPDALGGSRRVGHTSEQQIDSHPTRLLQGLADGRQTDVVSDIDVVKPDDGQFLEARTGHAPGQLSARPCAWLSLAAKIAVGGSGRSSSRWAESRAFSRLCGASATYSPGKITPAAAKRLPIAFQAPITGVNRVVGQIGVADESATTMTLLEQVLGRHLPAGPVVDADAAERFLRKLDQHGLQLMVDKTLGCRLVERQTP